MLNFNKSLIIKFLLKYLSEQSGLKYIIRLVVPTIMVMEQVFQTLLETILQWDSKLPKSESVVKQLVVSITVGIQKEEIQIMKSTQTGKEDRLVSMDQKMPLH